MPMKRMLRIYFMQQWFNLSDPAMEDSLYDSEAMRRFAQIELQDDAVPDETTILRFRHLLEQHQLTQQIFALVRGLLESKRLLLRSGTIVDAMIIDAPPSTKNEAKARDPEMKQGKKNARVALWHEGPCRNRHPGGGTHARDHARGSLRHQAAAAAAARQGEVLYGDQAYWSGFHRQGARESGVRYRVNRRAPS
jgi:transposase, IS5 family